ncbi:MAG: leucine-rich repeat protein, partial [Clostridia bacterium]|nr:leucine-rich repeat protein [Clostridia bacterium]
VIVQSGVRSIKKGAFMNAGSLKTVFFDADLTIDADVFEGTTVELDVPMFSTLADFCADHFSTGDVTFKLHTPKSCFEYETTETTVKITRLKSDCAHSHNVLVVPDYIDGRRVTKIGDLAFANGGIVDLTLPVLLDEIGDGAFYGNELATISMAAPRTVTEDEEVIYNNGTFEIMLSYHETDLLYTTLINKVNGVLIAYIDGTAEEYGVPTGVTTVGYGAFYKANVRVVTLGSEVTRIETAAFYDSSVEEVEGLENVVYVGDSAFENTGITEFAFGSALTQIGSAAFAGTNVRSITFGEENATDNGFYRYENNVLYEYGDRMAYTMTLHSVFKAYVADAANAGDFLTVADHFTVDEVEYKLSQIGAYAFKSLDLSGHNGIVIIPSAKNLVLFDGAFVNDTITEVHFESRVDAQAAADKVYFSADTFVYYPQGSALAAALEAVGHVAKSLAVTPKEFLKFTEHEALGTVTVTGTNSSVTNLVIPVYINAKLVTVVGDPAGNSDFANRRIATLVITDRVTELAEEAFKNCVTLREVTLGKGITVIPNGAFEGCSLLKTVTMSEDVTIIGAAAFKDTILTAIPVVVNGGMAKVTEIGASAFENVRSLTEIKFWGTPAGSLAIGDNA